MISHCGFECISLMTNDVEGPWDYALAHHLILPIVELHTGHSRQIMPEQESQILMKLMEGIYL